jgi:hypothetical protein
MVSGGLAVIATLVALQSPTELEAGATLDLRGGQAPTGLATGSGTAAEQSQLMASATPLVGLRWSGVGEELRLRSATRVLWRPVPLLHTRPLVLETFDATHVARPSLRSRWQTTLRSTYGEEDYTSLVQQFANQPALPVSRTLFTVNATGDGTWLASRLTTLALGINGLYRRALDDQTIGTASGPSTVPAMPTQLGVSVTPAVRHRLDRRTRIDVLATVGDADIRDIVVFAIPAGGTTTGATGTTTGATGRPDVHVNLLTLQPQLGLVRDLNRGQQLRTYAGVTYAAVLINPDKTRDWLPLTPLVRLELDTSLWRTRESAVRSVLAAGTTWFPDPVLGLAVWRGNAEARLDGQFGPRWNASVRAGFTTNLNAPLTASVTGMTSIDETVLQVDAPVRYRWSEQVTLEFGGRYAERAPNVRASNFEWRNRELWAFFTMTGTTYQAARARP